MSRVIRRHWVGDFSGPSRRDNRACEYEAYVPDMLDGRSFRIDGSVAADLADAEVALARLNAEATSLVNTESLARILLRAESVASSRIEGLEVGPRRLLRAEAALQAGDNPSDVTTVEVLGNIDAMEFGVQQVSAGTPVTVQLLLDVHQRLLSGTPLALHGGRFRAEQNWIGGSSYNPCSAAFVPPPPELVPGLMDDLVAFVNDESLPPIAQAAIAHAQFETIHPFVDGNGRTGRALIHLVLRRRGMADRVVPPVSLVLATRAREYVDGLAATRYRGPATGGEAHEGLNLWLGLFAGACNRAVQDASSFEQRMAGLELQWREQLGRIRAGSAADELLGRIGAVPILTVTGGAKLIGRTYAAANDAMTRLADAGILRQITVGRRNRAFEAPDVIAAFTDLERQLASPAGDTRMTPPSRPVPRRRQASGAPPSRARAATRRA
jgi:Fic family protein